LRAHERDVASDSRARVARGLPEACVGLALAAPWVGACAPSAPSPPPVAPAACRCACEGPAGSQAATAPPEPRSSPPHGASERVPSPVAATIARTLAEEPPRTRVVIEARTLHARPVDPIYVRGPADPIQREEILRVESDGRAVYVERDEDRVRQVEARLRPDALEAWHLRALKASLCAVRPDAPQTRPGVRFILSLGFHDLSCRFEGTGMEFKAEAYEVVRDLGRFTSYRAAGQPERRLVR
jgi:hypothetical protein